MDVQFVNVAREAGLRTKTIFGRENKNRFLLETTGCGVAFYDYDHDGWLDIFLVNGTRFEATWVKGEAPISRLYKNNAAFPRSPRLGICRRRRLRSNRLWLLIRRARLPATTSLVCARIWKGRRNFENDSPWVVKEKLFPVV